MSENNIFIKSELIYNLKTPTKLEHVIYQWNQLKSKMIKSKPEDFTRTEWAYLINFVSSSNLNQYLKQSFGQEVFNTKELPDYIIYPSEKIALWLPNNVSLLGPLTLILVSLTGAKVRVKIGSTGKNLLTPFINWINNHCEHNDLKSWINNNIATNIFSRDSLQNAEFCKWADVRILFGSNEAARAIESLEHPINSTGIYFTDKISEIWIDSAGLSEQTILDDICKIIQIYGQKGCTSPKRICLLDITKPEATLIAQKLSNHWEKLNFPKCEQYVASNNFFNHQLAMAKGHPSILFKDNNANVSITPSLKDIFLGNMQINIQYGNFEDLELNIPQNIQTIGASLHFDNYEKLISIAHEKKLSRIVPIIEMHNFDIHWDSMFWWKSLFRSIKIKKKS